MPSAKALAEDLGTLSGPQAYSCPGTRWSGRQSGAYGFRRNPALAATMAAAAIVVAVVAGVGLWSVFEERDHYHQERDHAQANLYRALVGEARSQMDARDTGWWWRVMDNLRAAAQLRVADRDLDGLRDLAIECMGSAYPSMRLHGAWTGHTGPVTAVVVSPDGRLAASASRDQTVRIWSMPEGEPLAVLTGHTGAVTSLAFHPNSGRLASCSTDGSVRLWDLAPEAARTGGGSPGEFRLLQVFDPKAGRLSSVAVAPDGAWLATGGQDTKVHLIWIGGKSVSSAQSVADQSTIRHDRILEGHSGPINGLAFSPTGELASSGADLTIRLWDIAAGKQTSYSPINVMSAAGQLSFFGRNDFNDERAAALGKVPTLPTNQGPGTGDLLAWAEPEAYGFRTKDRLLGGKELSAPGAHTGCVTQVCWGPKGAMLSASEDGSLKLWRYGNGSKDTIEERATARGDFGAVFSAAFSPDGHWAVAGYFDGQIRLWQVATPPQKAIVWSKSQTAAFIGAERRLVNSRQIYDFSAGLEAPSHHYTPPAIGALAVQSAGRSIAFNQGGILCVWDRQTATELRRWPAHDLPIRALASSPNGKELASIAADGAVKIWDWETGHLDRKFSPGIGALHAVAWSRDGLQLAATGEHGAVLWDLDRTSEPRWRIEHDLPISAVAFGKDVVAVTSSSGTVAVRDPRSGNLLHMLRGHSKTVEALAFNPDGSLLASGAAYDSVRLWDAARAMEVAVFDLTYRQTTSFAIWLAFDPRGHYLAANSLVWDLHSKSLVGAIYAGVRDLCGEFLADGSTLLLGTEFGTVRSCSLAGIDQARKAVPADGQLKLDSGPIRLEALKIIVPGGHVEEAWGIASSPDGRWVATAGFDQTVKLWDARNMTLVRTLTGHSSLVWSVAFSPDSQLLATGSETEHSGEIRLWEVATGKQIHRFEGHTQLVLSLAFHPTRPLLASSSQDGSVLLWDLSARKSLGLLHRFEQEVRGLAFRPDGNSLVAACHDHRIAIWDWERSPTLPSPPHQFLTGHSGAVWSVGFNADGTMLASGSERGVIILWNGKTFEKLATLWGSTGQIRGLSFTRDSQLLAGASYGAPIIVWDLALLRRSLQDMGLGDLTASHVETRTLRQD